jgi:hypothetical protein
MPSKKFGKLSPNQCQNWKVTERVYLFAGAMCLLLFY